MEQLIKKKFFYNLYNLLKHEYVKNINIDLKETTNKFKLSSDFIPKNISETISTYTKNYTIDTPLIKCNIWCKNFTKKLLKDFKIILSRFYTLVNFFNNNGIVFNKQKFTLDYIPTKLKKCLPKIKNSILGPNEINSGLSYIYNNHICIWREEEFYKVFLHELFHCIGFDRFLIESDNTCTINRYYNVKKHINCNEGYNEFCALIYHCCFLKIENNSYNLCKLIHHNRLFTLLQIKKILNHYSTNNIYILKDNEFKQNTSVFSYFILKGMYLFYINEFINILQKHTFFLYPNDTFIEKIIQFNTNKFNDKQYNTTLNIVCTNYKKKLSNSLRMSYI